MKGKITKSKALDETIAGASAILFGIIIELLGIIILILTYNELFNKELNIPMIFQIVTFTTMLTLIVMGFIFMYVGKSIIKDRYIK